MAHHPKLTLAEHLSSAELQARYRASTDAATARRWQALWQLSLGVPLGSAATLVGLHRNTIRALLARYNQHGPDAVSDGRARNRGRRPYLSAEQEAELSAALRQSHPDGGRWTGPRVAAWIADATGRQQVHPQYGWVLLRRLGLTLQVPRPRHRDAATPAEQAEWKKN